MNSHIRNFVIIAHIDHGKSTLADRFLEVTGTIAARRMHAQYLDQLDLEQERGITIKMAPVRMRYKPTTNNQQPTTGADGRQSLIVSRESSNSEFILNLIDTPGHSDFSYEVSRALHAVEGAILLVDVSQGIQAQTLANLRSARAAGLIIIGALNKVDLLKSDPHGEERLRASAAELAELVNCKPEDILWVSGKTGEGVVELLGEVIRKLPSPKHLGKARGAPRALIFDSFYDNHRGVVASVRVFHGEFLSDDTVYLVATRAQSKLKELGHLAPEPTKDESLGEGMIGYLATGIKDPDVVHIGDTVVAVRPENRQKLSEEELLEGYREPKPVVFVSFYPDSNDDHELLLRSLKKLKLNDAALVIEPDQNDVLGRGFKVGFLGRLHFEITAERLSREYGVETVNTFPSVAYRIKTPRGWEVIVQPDELPDDALEIQEPVVRLSVLVPHDRLPALFPIQARYRFTDTVTESFHDRVELRATMPLAELVGDFDDQVKSATEGYASFSYELAGYAKADIVKLEVRVTDQRIPGLSRFVPREGHERDARKMAERLKSILPQRQHAQPIQIIVGGRVVAREDITALRKDVTGYLYGGDRSRKMKLWKKQKRGKERLAGRAETRLTPEMFKELLKK